MTADDCLGKHAHEMLFKAVQFPRFPVIEIIRTLYLRADQVESQNIIFPALHQRMDDPVKQLVHDRFFTQRTRSNACIPQTIT